MSPVSKGTLSSVPSNHSDTPTTLASHITRTIANSTNRSIVPPTSSHPKTSQQSSVMVSLIFLYFRITNLQFTSSLEDPSTSYYKDLQRRISELVSTAFPLYHAPLNLGLGYPAGALPCWCWSVFWSPWPSSMSSPWLCVSADERTVGSWTSFRPGMPTIL
uniref:Mucin-1 n=1 Tax=Sus scrofa TaxID=9823 RepID=A0A8D0Q3F9_PIG